MTEIYLLFEGLNFSESNPVIERNNEKQA